ncbi:MAG: class I SAM-dependent methyltransferase [Acidimicrobiales bacterium]
MSRHVRLRELLVGVEGLALLRHLYDGADADADQRLAEVRRLLDDPSFSAGEPTSEADARAGYRSWSEHYDEPGNPIIAIEEPVVWGLLDRHPQGEALDAACGTGRHARYLAKLGYRVVGVDLTTEMLDRARANVPTAAFAEADLRALPIEDGRFDVVVSGLAFAHLADLDVGIAEVARVLRRGGQAVISVLHPFQAHLGWHAPFEDAEGHRGFVREHSHTHADYLAAFQSCGLQVRSCVEPELSIEEARAKRRAFRHVPEATAAAYVGLPGVLVWDVLKL